MEKEKETPKITGIVKALGLFQSECPAISKEKTAKGTKFSYKYGSLPHILETIKPHMKKAALAFTQPIVFWEGAEYIMTILFHTGTGEKIESKMLLPKIEFQGMNELQSKGSTITYLRRYGLMSILGLVTEEDDNDAQGKTEPAAKETTTKEPAQPAVPAKPWLNPEVEGKANPLWNKALKYLADGGKIADIKKKYRIGKNLEERLLSDSLNYDDLPFDREQAEIDATTNPDAQPNELFDQQGRGE